jgi:hypothetical protein
MATVRPDPGEPGPECICGAELKRVPLPEDIAEMSGEDEILIHVETGDTRCYPDHPDQESRACMAEAIE